MLLHLAHMKRRLHYAGLLAVTMVLGLASRQYGASIPPFVAEYAGDTLWALLVYWLVRMLWPRGSLQRAFMASLAFAFCIELSQLYQADWINAVRSNRFAALVLGQGFLWSDFLCYTIGVLSGFLIDRQWLSAKTTSARV